MNIISEFSDFYDTQNTSNSSVQYYRNPKYIKNSEEFDGLVSEIPIRRAQNLLKKYKRWSETYSKPMEGNGYYMAFEYNVIGIFPHVYLVPVAVVYKMGLGRNCTSNPDTPVEFFYKDPMLVFNSNALREIGNKYGMDFVQYKGKGPNKKPLHRVILRKFTDIESSFFYLGEYISPDDIVIESVENLRSPDFRELFHMIESPLFYISRYSFPKHEIQNNNGIMFGNGVKNNWILSIDPDFSEVKYLDTGLFVGEGICSRIEEYIIEHPNIKRTESIVEEPKPKVVEENKRKIEKKKSKIKSSKKYEKNN